MNVAPVREVPRVLLVEDSLPIRQRLRSLIDESGLARVVGEAASVERALAQFQVLAPDAVVLDLQLTDGTGYAVLESIKRSAPACTAIVMTNFAIPEYRERCDALGADHFLEKSVDFERVPELLAGVVSSAPAGRSAAVRPDHHFRHLIEALGAAVYTCDADGRIDFCNEAAVALWGREPELGREYHCGAWRVYGSDGQALRPGEGALAQLLRDGVAIDNQPVIIERPDGSRRHVLPQPQAIFGPSGAIIGALSILVDITPLRQAEAAERHSLMLAQATLDSLSAHVCVLDEQGVIVAVNQAWRDFGAAHGADPGRVNEGNCYFAACAPDAGADQADAIAFGAGLRRVVSGQVDRFEHAYPCQGAGEQRWFVGRVTRLAGSDPVRIVVAHEDITERTLTERALFEHEQRWTFAIEGSGDGMWDYDVVRDRVAYSRRWKEMLGYAEHEIGDRGEEWIDRLHADDRTRVLALSNACLEGRQPSFSAEFRLRCKDGSWKWVHDRGAVIARAADGTALRMTGTHTDIDVRKQAEGALAELELQLRKSQKLEAVGMLASSIAHDFNNIMGAVLGNVALAREDLDPDHVAAANLVQIQIAAQRARSLVQRILSFARRQPHAMHLQALQPLVQESVDLLRAMLPSGVALDVRFGKEPVLALVDATQLNQVLMNLGTNAWQALGGRAGRVEIGLDAIALDAVAGAALSGLPAGRFVHLWLRDGGCGMDEATRQRIFEPFFTTKPEGQGTGLGLSVVRSIVHAHQGEILVESTPGVGTCFHIYLPAHVGDLSAIRTEEPAALALTRTPRASGQRVMYIDDDETMVLLVRQMLPREGFHVSCFADAQHALDELGRDPRAFDVVVTDYNMPRMSGLDVTDSVRGLRNDMPVIISSGSLTDELVNGARHACVNGLINKERTFEDLGPEILRVLAAAEADGSSRVR